MIPTTTREQVLEDLARELWGLLDSIAGKAADINDLAVRERIVNTAALRFTFGRLADDGHLNLLGLPEPPPFVADPTREMELIAQRATAQAWAKGFNRLESENRELLAEQLLLTQLLHSATRRLAEHAAPDHARPARAQQQHQAAGVGPPEDGVRGPADEPRIQPPAAS